MAYYNATTQMYTQLWNKYRPAILKLMVDSADGPQQYKFLNHEFKGINPREKGGYAFHLEVFGNKSVNDIRTSSTAKDLLAILQNSNKATELTAECSYEFSMDKDFILHIKKGEMPIEEVIEDETTETETKAQD